MLRNALIQSLHVLSLPFISFAALMTLKMLKAIFYLFMKQSTSRH